MAWPIVLCNGADGRQLLLVLWMQIFFPLTLFLGMLFLNCFDCLEKKKRKKKQDGTFFIYKKINLSVDSKRVILFS